MLVTQVWGEFPRITDEFETLTSSAFPGADTDIESTGGFRWISVGWATPEMTPKR